MRKILIVVESIDVNSSSGAKGRMSLIKSLIALGYGVKILHYTRKNIEIEGVDCISIKELKYNLLYVLSRTRRLVLRHFKVDLFSWVDSVFGFSFTYYNDSNSIAASIRKHYTDEDYIFTLSHGGNFKSHHAMLKFPKLYKKWVAYMHDPYPFHCYPKPYNWYEKGYEVKEQFIKDVSDKAEFSVFPSLLLMQWMGNYFPNFLKTGSVIPHQSYDLEIRNKRPLKLEYFDFNKFTILHAGNLLKQRQPQGLVEAYKLFLKKIPEAKQNSLLLLLGDASEHKEYLLEEKTKCSSLYCSMNYVSFDEANYVQEYASVNVILEADADISPFLPGKFPHCVKSNSPIMSLAPEQSEVRRLLGLDYKYACRPSDSTVISEFLIELYFLWKETPEKLKLNRPDIEGYLSTEFLQKQLNAMFKNEQ
ncbi:UDP-glycosyltransferase [Meridianimaribacter flavus]|uniref:UDP-glycosyltransferase n=1 Tax=Meridianimaribacter flavus TaxID=571115 RepID=A0ABY2G5S8_9FLAO|nr:UDP-glycosyltransferase [Meridianimaribacter flavus]TDY11778.1 hypothetical protein A8975_1617 [Meridianimaribacter flavus]